MLVPVEKSGDRGHVLSDGPVWEEADLLDDVTDAAPEFVYGHGFDRATVDPDRARSRLDEPVDHLESRCLPAPGRSDEHGDLSALDVEVELIDRGCRRTGEDLR